MRTRLIAIFVIFAVSGVIVAAQLGAFQADETRTIPMNTVFATFKQEGFWSLDEVTDSEGVAELSGRLQESPQQLVMCVGQDLAVAVKACAASFSMPAEPPPIVSGTTSDTLWLVAYLGSDGSIPPAYQVRSIDMCGRTIRVAYERDESPLRSCDLRAYVIWVPVGLVESGAYTLELFDVSTGEVTLTRPWQVTVR